MIALWIFLGIIGFVISLVILYFITRFMTFRIATWVNIANTQYEDSLKKGTPNKDGLDVIKSIGWDKEIKSIRDEKVKTAKELEDEIKF